MNHYPQALETVTHWLFWLALAGIVVIGGAILIFLHRKRVQTDYLTACEISSSEK